MAEKGAPHVPVIDLDTERPVEIVQHSTYDEQKALFDRYHHDKEYVIDGVIHNAKRPGGGN